MLWNVYRKGKVNDFDLNEPCPTTLKKKETKEKEELVQNTLRHALAADY